MLIPRCVSGSKRHEITPAQRLLSVDSIHREHTYEPSNIVLHGMKRPNLRRVYPVDGHGEWPAAAMNEHRPVCKEIVRVEQERLKQVWRVAMAITREQMLRLRGEAQWTHSGYWYSIAQNHREGMRLGKIFPA
jgi:hypothetical protein